MTEKENSQTEGHFIGPEPAGPTGLPASLRKNERAKTEDVVSQNIAASDVETETQHSETND